MSFSLPNAVEIPKGTESVQRSCLVNPNWFASNHIVSNNPSYKWISYSSWPFTRSVLPPLRYYMCNKLVPIKVTRMPFVW
jgi:hypothetical protein